MSNFKVLRTATKKDCRNINVNWFVKHVETKGGWLAEIDGERAVFIKEKDGSYISLLVDGSLMQDIEDATSEESKILDSWNVKKQVNPSTAKTFEELIDEL
jgi:hypothetical protein